MSETYDHETGEVVYAVPSVVSQEIDIQIATSRKYPRRKDQEIAVAIMSRATLNLDIASECIYNLPRGGKTIQGPSIRFAEIVRSCYGNIRVASRFVRIDADDRQRQAVICEAVAFDTQLNDVELAQVRRSIMTSGKSGAIPRPYDADMTATTIMATQAIARRNSILALVPKAVWIDGFGKVEEVVRGTAETLSVRREKMLKEFSKFGVTDKQLFAAFGIDSEQEIYLNDMPVLAGMWSALKDGEAAESVLGMIAANRPRAAQVETANPMANAPKSTTRVELSAEELAKGTEDGLTLDQIARKKLEAQRAAEAAAKAADPPKERTRTRKAPEPKPEAQPEPPAETRDRDVEAAQESREAQGNGSADPLDIPASLKRAPPAKPVEEQTPFEKAVAFIGAFEGTPADLMDWWRSVKDARKMMSFEETGELNKIYNSKFADLNKAQP